MIKEKKILFFLEKKRKKKEEIAVIPNKTYHFKFGRRIIM